MNPWLAAYLIGIPVNIVLQVILLIATDDWDTDRDLAIVILSSFAWPITLTLMIVDFLDRLLRRK